MRELKFRSWNKNTGHMFNIDILTINGPKGDGYIKTKGLKSDLLGCPIMQYTGLKDKNGKEIYEGDIVEVSEFIKEHKLTRKIYEVIEWITPNFWRVTLDKEMPEHAKAQYLYEDEEYIIIGNIYENPELLK